MSPRQTHTHASNRSRARARSSSATSIVITALGCSSLIALATTGCSHNTPTRACHAGTHGAERDLSCSPAPLHSIPFRRGFETQIMQGYHGNYSHKEDLSYSLDFRCDEGDPVVASRHGVVWSIREDSDAGCADTSCIEQANYVILDHGDGTYSEYYHLAHLGALVEVGDQICAGQVIGVCGNTGFSSGAHLHWSLTDVARRTIPSRFEEMQRQRGSGYAIPEVVYTSENPLEVQCADTPYSMLPREAFIHQGILLDDELPLQLDRGESDQVIAGVYYGDHPRVAIHRKHESSGSWEKECVSLDARRRFRVPYSWKQGRHAEGYHWFMITGADKQCNAPGWAWSYKVRLDGAATTPPRREQLRGPLPPEDLLIEDPRAVN